MEEMFINIAGSHLADMRLLIEGAVDLYEDDAMPLNRLAIQNDMLIASNAFDTIGTAYMIFASTFGRSKRPTQRKASGKHRRRENMCYHLQKKFSVKQPKTPLKTAKSAKEIQSGFSLTGEWENEQKIWICPL